VIQGSLQANGQVFLSNPNGVLFTKDAQVNVGSLVATTLHMSNEDLASGRYRLQGKSDKSVTNQGSITATGGDGKGGVALIAAKIINEGSITADRGTVALAAAHKVTLDLGGPVKVQIEEGALNALIEQGGAVRADGGTVIMTAEGAGALMAAAINHKGLTMAHTLATGENGKIQIGIAKKGNVSIEGKLDVSAAQGKAGTIEVTAENITLKTNASINANGAYGGGTVLIGGDWQGSGTLTQAKKVKMEQGARIDASATVNGDGGKVVLWSDIKNTESITSVAGSINTLGAGNGKGGQVETSGHQLGVLGDVNAGRGGDWLLDPVDIWITESSGTDITSNTNVVSSDEIIKASSISATLSNGANVTITTAQASSPTCISGTITVFDSITSNSSTPVSLNLLGNSSITLLAGVNITSTSGSLTVNLSPNLSNTGGNIILMGNNVIETKGGSVLFGTVSRRAQGLSNVDNNGLELRQGVSILTDGGDISLYGKSASTSGAGIFIQKNVTLNSGSGKIWIDGEAGSPTTNGSRGNGVVFFANAGTGAIGAFDANAAANINIISTNADNTSGWESNLNFASPITIKAATVNSINTTIPANSRFNTATGMLINWTGGGANGSVNIYSPQGHAKWIADGGDLSISARAPVQLNANGAVVAWGAKTGTTLPDIGSTTSEFNLNVTQNLITSAAMNGMLSFLGTTSGVMVQNCGSGWIPTESQLQTRFNSTKLSLGDSTVNNMTLTDSVNMANNTLNINAKNTLWTTTNFSSSKTITNTGNVTLVADSVTLGDVWTIGGGLIIQPRTASASIGLGNTLGGLNITRATFQNLNVSSPTAVITIGRSDGTGDINFTDGSPLAWTGATTFITGTGNITLNTSSSTPGTSDINVNGSLALTTNGSIKLGGQIQTTANQTLSGDVVLLRDTTLLSTAGAINSPSNFSLTSGNLNINQALTSTLAGLISGTQAIAKSGAGTLILSGNNTYTGVTTINQGKLAIGAGGAGGELQSSSIINNGDLEFNSSADHIYAGIISGTGSLRKLGSGALTLNATASDFSGDHGTYSSFTGNVFVDQGVLKLNNQQNVVSPTTSSIGNIAVSGRSITVNNTGILEFSQSHVLGNALTTPVILLTINSGGVVRNNNTFNTLGDIVLSGGTLSSNGGLSSSYQAFNLVGKIATSGGNVSSIGGTGLHGGFHLAANTFFTISDATGNDSPDITVSAALLDGVDNSGSKGLTKSGAGTMLLTGESTYTGSTSISAGTLIVGNGSNGSITGTSSIINNANLTFNRTTDITYNATFSGLSTANFTQAGTGALIWSGNGSAYAGNVRLNCGTLAINGNTGGIASIGTGTLFFNGGTLRYTSNYNADNSSKFSTAAGQLYRIDTNSEDVVFGTALTSSNGTLFKTGAGKLSLTAANTYTGTTTIAAGILSIGNGGTTGSIAAGSELVNCATLAFNLTNDVIFSRLISGSGNLSQIGSGRLILTANNTYTGNTTISAGSLVLGNNDVSGSILNTSSIINNSNLICLNYC
jgi:autotransporter-associated beta strand protein